MLAEKGNKVLVKSSISLQNAYCISLACLSFTLCSLALTNAFSRSFLSLCASLAV
jgi:hypothetical protein